MTFPIEIFMDEKYLCIIFMLILMHETFLMSVIL
jgi:hypothetical protein